MDFISHFPGNLILFLLLSTYFTRISWRPLHNPHCHGFYRYFVFEGIALLLTLNLPYWFADRYSLRQGFSWLLLFGALALVLHAVFMLRSHGGQRARSHNPENFKFENTSELVTGGIFRYVRHPMYTSLLLLSWGILLKHPTFGGLLIALLATLCMLVAANKEEQENLAYFGDVYRDYVTTTKKFIPLVF